jgi:hypothetical protein
MNSPANSGDEIRLTFIESRRGSDNPTFPSAKYIPTSMAHRSVLKPLRIKTGEFPINQLDARVIVNDNIVRREVKVVKNEG